MPILGDTKYKGAAIPRALQVSSASDNSRALRSLTPQLFLHCKRLEMVVGEKQAWAAEAPVPPHFQKLMAECK